MNAASRITRRTFLYGTFLTGAGALAACSNIGPTGDNTDDTGGGSDGGSGSSGASGSASASSGSAAQSGSGAGASVLTATIAQGVDPTTLDPMQQRETTTVNVLMQIYDSLLERPTDNMSKIEGLLAEKFEMVDDLTMKLTLKEGVTFSDGSPFTSADVVYSFNYLLGTGPFSKPSIAAYQFETIESVTADGDMTVTIKTAKPDPLLPARLTALYVIKNNALADDPDALASKAMGTGPYTLDTWDRNSQVVMSARADYHGGTPKIDKVVFRTIPEDSSRIAALKTGDVDLITNVPADNITELKSEDTIRIEDVPSARIASVWLNALKDGPLANPDVRLALNYAVDVDAIIKHVMSGYGTRVATFVPDYFEGYDPSVKPIPFNPDQAKSLLEKAGYGDGFEMTMMVPEGRYAFATDVTQAMIPYLKDVGVTLKLNVVEFGVFAKATQDRDIGDSFYGAWGNSFFNPLDELTVAVVTSDDGFSWFSNKEIDKLTEQAGETIDETKRLALFTEIQNKLLKDPPFIFLFAYVDLYGLRDRFDFQPRSDEALPMFGASVKS